MIENWRAQRSETRGLSQLWADVKQPSVVLVLLAGIVISLTMFLISQRHYRSEHVDQLYQEQAMPLSMVLGRTLDRYLETAYSVSGLYSATSSVQRDEFRTFVDRSLTRYRGIQALEWIPRVPAEERATYEEAARRDGLLDFRIRERAPSGEMVPAAAREEYFPVYFVEPLAGNGKAAGFDLASNPARLAALNRARDTGKMVGTQRIRLVQETGSQFGFLAFVPLYSTGMVPGTVAERREKLTGFTLGVFRIGDILHTAMATTGDLVGLDLYILDRDAPPGERFLHYRPGGDSDGSAPPISEERVLTGDFLATTISVAGRDWQLVYRPVIAWFHGYANLEPWIIAAFGLLMTMLLVRQNMSTNNRTREVELTVRGRTQELHSVNRALEDEMAERENAEQALQVQNESLQLIQKTTVAANAAANFDDALRVCVDEVCAYTGWPVGHAFLVAEDGAEELVSTNIWHLEDQEQFEDFVRVTSSAHIVPGTGLIGRVAASGKPHWVVDVNKDPDYVRARSTGGLSVKAAFAFPVLAGSTVVAVLEFYSVNPLEPDGQTLEIMAQLGTQLARARNRRCVAGKNSCV